MTAAITGIFSYPVKSCRGIAHERAQLAATGFEGDRHWMLVRPNGRFVTQRELPRLALVGTQLTPTSLALTAPGMPTLEVGRVLFRQSRLGLFGEDELAQAKNPLPKLPSLAEEAKGDDPLFKYDVIILGDVEPAQLPLADTTPRQGSVGHGATGRLLRDCQAEGRLGADGAPALAAFGVQAREPACLGVRRPTRIGESSIHNPDGTHRSSGLRSRRQDG